VELGARRGVDAELEAWWTSATWVRDLVQDGANGRSSLVASLSIVTECLKVVSTPQLLTGSAGGPGQRWLPFASRFGWTEQDLLSSGCFVGLTEDRVDALCI
jgi:hypothetical protein